MRSAQPGVSARQRARSEVIQESYGPPACRAAAVLRLHRILELPLCQMDLAVGVVLRLVGVARAQAESMQGLADALAGLQAIENRLRGDRGSLRPQVGRQHIGR